MQTSSVSKVILKNIPETSNNTSIAEKLLINRQNKCDQNKPRSAGYYNKKEVKTDIKNFEREIRLKSFFELKNQEKPNGNHSTSSDNPNIKPITVTRS